MQDDFFYTALKETCFDSVATLQRDLDRWLEYYNTERPHPGYRNWGRRPIETVQHYLQECGT